VLRANDDTRGALGNRRATRCHLSSAPLENFLIDYLKIRGSFMCLLHDHGIDHATVESQRTAFDRFDKTATARVQEERWLTAF
jgi:hypothetical protein